MHFEWGTWMNLSLIHIVGQVSKRVPEASEGCPSVGQNENKEEHKWEVNRNLFVTNICTKICLS
jgi:hypothetical protein